MYKIQIISIIINIILLFLFYLIIKNGYSKDCEDYPIYNKILLSNIISTANSGDLLLFSNSRCNVFTRTFGNPYYSHIGIIVNKNNKLYSLELVKNDHVAPKIPPQVNVIFTPLDDRILNYSGYVYYCKLNNKLSSENEKKLFNIAESKVEYKIYKGCGYFIAKILEDINISKNLTTWKFWQIHNNIIRLTKNIIYTNPILIISDKLLINNINQNKLMNYC